MSLLILGDALDNLTFMPGGWINTCACSPSYWQQRDYEVVGQIGREQTVREYLERLWAVFDEVYRVLRPDGTCWVNLGDKYVDKCLQLIPEQFAVGMRNRGWIVRNVVTWQKTNCKPESVKSRFSQDSESLYFFAKSTNHYFAKQYEPYSPKTIQRCQDFLRRKEKFDPARHKQDKRSPSQAPMLVLERIAKHLDGRGRGVRSVWSMPTAQYAGAHFAVWPPQLVRRILLAGCPPSGIVLDPFVGSGTTLIVAEELGCTGIGIDLNPDYLEQSRQNILKARADRFGIKLA